MAKVDVKIKLVTINTKRRDKYLQRKAPLSAVIRFDDRHSHSTDSADALRLLRGTRSTRQTFLRYFSEGMTPSEARRLLESKLSKEDEGPAKLANAALNPPQITVYHWHSVWREACFGSTYIDPVLKLEERASLYAAKYWASFNVQVVVDDGGLFMNVSCRAPGSAHESTALKMSALYKCSDNLVPHGFSMLRGTAIPFMLVGDPAYPLLPWIMKGYTGVSKTEVETQHRRFQTDDKQTLVTLEPWKRGGQRFFRIGRHSPDIGAMTALIVSEAVRKENRASASFSPNSHNFGDPNMGSRVAQETR
ncbi:hypothetical protein MRX96_058452 [Rhipicephalus microplus]